MLFLCVRPLVDKFLAVLVQAGAALDQLLGFEADGLGEEVGVRIYHSQVLAAPD